MPYWHFRPALFSRGNLLTCPQRVELIGELADGGRPHQGRGPLLSVPPVWQCRLDRGLARGREIGDALALVDVPNLDPNQAAALQRIEVAAHRGAVQRGLRGQARDGQRAKARELAQDGELGDAQPRGRQSRIIGGGDRARGAAERGAGARCLELQCLEFHSRVYTPFRWKCKPTNPASRPIFITNAEKIFAASFSADSRGSRLPRTMIAKSSRSVWP